MARLTQPTMEEVKALGDEIYAMLASTGDHLSQDALVDKADKGPVVIRIKWRMKPRPETWKSMKALIESYGSDKGYRIVATSRKTHCAMAFMRAC